MKDSDKVYEKLLTVLWTFLLFKIQKNAEHQILFLKEGARAGTFFSPSVDVDSWHCVSM